MASAYPATSWQRDATAVAEALFATRDGPPSSARITWLVDDLAHFLDTVGGRSKLVFHAALKAVALASPLMVFKVRAFHELPLEARIQALDRLEHSALGLSVFAVKTLLCFIWYEHPDSAIEVGLVKNVRAMASHRPRGLQWP